MTAPAAPLTDAEIAALASRDKRHCYCCKGYPLCYDCALRSLASDLLSTREALRVAREERAELARAYLTHVAIRGGYRHYIGCVSRHYKTPAPCDCGIDLARRVVEEAK